jgi:predicted permease
MSDLRYVLRSLARAPGFTLAVVATLALGIGAATAIYSLTAWVLFPPTPYAEPDRLVRIELSGLDSIQSVPLYRPFFLAYRERATTLQSFGGLARDTMNLVVNGEPEGVSVGTVTANFFGVLGVQPALGRTFAAGEEEAGNDKVAVLTHRLWKNRFGSEATIVGRDIRLNEQNYRVIGVLAEEFALPLAFGGAQLYVPLVLPKTATDMSMVSTLARLKPGQTPEQAQAELRTLQPDLPAQALKFLEKARPVVSVAHAPPGYPEFQRYRTMSWVALGAVAAMYAIACVNATQLFLVRTLGRRRDLCLRLALGAQGGTILRLLSWESLLLTGAASALGIAVAKWLFPVLLALAPSGGSSSGNEFRPLTLSWSALGFLAALGLFTGLAVAAVPAWRIVRLNVNEVLKEGAQAVGESRRLRFLRNVMIVVEATLAVLLLAGAGLMVRTFQRFNEVDVGFDPAQKFTVSIRTANDDRRPIPQQIDRYVRVVERLAQMPGVKASAMVPYLPAFSTSTSRVKIAGRTEGAEVQAAGFPMSPSYFDTLGVALRAGRLFDRGRPGDPPVVVLNETMARKCFAGQNPLGQQIEARSGEKWEIVGVVADTRSPREPAKPQYYYPYWQERRSSFTVYVRTAGEPGKTFAADVRRAVYGVDPKLAVSLVYPLQETMRNQIGLENFVLRILEVLAMLALLLAATGLFSVMAYVVAQRQGEFGLRLALGASKESLYRLVLVRGCAQVAGGVTLGLVGAWWLARYLQTILFEVSPHDPLIYGMVGLLMLLTAAGACALPARRATAVNPTRLLRAE